MLEYTEPEITLQATDKPLVIKYTYTTTVTNIPEPASPYYVIVNELCNIYWDNSLDTNNLKFTIGQLQIRINQPNIQCEKQQRNKTQGQTEFTTNIINNVNPGDIIEYELTLTNNGNATAYRIIISDTLSLNYLSSTAPNPTIQTGNVFNSVVGDIAPESSKTYIITCQVPSNYIKGTVEVNTFGTTYNPSTLGTYYLIGGPSNSVGIQNNLPVINPYFLSSQVTPSGNIIHAEGKVSTMIVGMKTPYYVQVTIPQGATLYNLQLKCSLSSGQIYVSDSFKGDGTLVSSTNSSITISLGAMVKGPTNFTSSYEIEAIETVNNQVQIQNPVYQYNVLTWDVTPNGIAAPSVNMSTYGYVTTLKLELILKHGFTPDNVSTNPLTLSNVGQEIFYELDIINNNEYPIYDISVYDSFQSSVLVQNISNVTPSGALILTEPLGNSTISGNIPVIKENSTVTITFIAKIIGPVVPGTTLTNQISTYYGTEKQTEGILYGITKSNKVQCSIPKSLIELNLTPTPSLVEVGDVLNYNLEIYIPQGMEMYNCVLLDTFPSGQVYLKNITPDVFSSTGNTGEVVLLTNPLINTQKGSEILNYTYGVQVEQLVNSPTNNNQPISETNQVMLEWAQSPKLPSDIEVNTNCQVLVSSPLITLSCEQQVVGKDKVFYESKASVNVGDNLEFKLTLVNIGSGGAYDVIVTCELSPFIEYVSKVSVTEGNITSDTASNQVIWTLPTVNAGQTEVLIFQVEVKEGVPAGSILQNTFSETNKTSNSGIVNSSQGNSLIEQSANIEVVKSSNPTDVVIGNKINYTLLVKVPVGVVFYNLEVIDVLPVGQIYDSQVLAIVNGKSTTPIINGQQIIFSSISSTTPSSTVETYTYTFTAKLEGIQNKPNGNVQNNLTYIQWDLDSKGLSKVVPRQDNININVIDNLINITKEQRISEINSSFTKEIIYATTGDIVEYQITVTNNSNENVSNILVTDTISNELKFIKVVNITGVINEALAQKGTINWSYNEELLPEQSISLVYQVQVEENNQNTIINEAVETFQNASGTSFFGNIYSNKVILKDIKTLFNFRPSKVNYVNSNEAESYGIVGCKGNITYVYTNTSFVPETINLQISPIPFNYYIFINGVFVQEVYKNTAFNSSLNQLTNILPGVTLYVALVYRIPQDYNIESNKNLINFSVSISTNKTHYISTINSYIYIGNISLNQTYVVSNYDPNPNMYSVTYNVEVNISQGVKIYDVQLRGYYSSSYIFQNATENNSKVNVTVNNGELIYPVISEVNALNVPVQINYAYTLLQYKNTPVGIGELEKSLINLDLRTSPNIEEKCQVEQNVESVNGDTNNNCIYVDSIQGQCVQYFKYTNIQIPSIAGFNIKNIVFNNPIIEDLDNTISSCKNFTTISYDFSVPYKIIYENQKCNTVQTTTNKGVLPQQSIKTNVYTPEEVTDSKQIISKVIVKNLCINNNSFTVCLGIVTYCTSKTSMLVKNINGTNILPCCTSRNNENKK